MSYINNLFPLVMSKGIHVLWPLFFLVVGWWLINKSRKFTVIFMQKANIEKSVMTFLDSLYALLLRIILILMILPHIGVDTSSIVTTFGISLAAVGLALKDTLSNIVSGVIMVIYKPFHIGDYIEVAGVSGIVIKVEIMCTTLISDDKKVIIVPNSKLISESIIRVSDHNIDCCTLEYELEEDINADSVKKHLQRVITLNDKILHIPPVEVSIVQEQDNGKKVQVVFWTEKVNSIDNKDNIDKAVYEFINKCKLKYEYNQ